MTSCCDLIFITTIACQIADCLDDDELSLLAADTVLLSDALNAILARRSMTENCTEDNELAKTISSCNLTNNKLK